MTKIKQTTLKNGLKVIIEDRKADTVTIQICVNTGSNNESKADSGISHFLEHMAFEGTNKRTAKQISETIENIGGELNASTSNYKTSFYVKVPKDKAELGLDIISDIIKNPIFEQKIFDKEKKVVLEEIKMIHDQPMMYQWYFFQQNIFRKHPSRNPVPGTLASVKKITREQMKRYHKRWYVPNNMQLTIVGDAQKIKGKIEKYFGDMRPAGIPPTKKIEEPAETKPRLFKEYRNIDQSYVILGHKTVSRLHKDSYTLDVIEAIFSKGLSGRITEEIRLKRGLAYSVGTHHDTEKDCGFFAFYLNTQKKNVELCKSLILEEIKKLSNLGRKELEDAKQHIIGTTLLENENSSKRADDLAFWGTIKDASLADKYLAAIKKVTVADVVKARNKYFKDNYTMIVIEKK
jgi:predicted Zn-dependent peptidase